YSINQVPRDVTKQWLDRLGLTPSEKFYRLLEQPDAEAYQFKLLAGKAGSAHKDKDFLELPEKPLASRDRYVGELNKVWADNELLTEQFKELNAIKDRLEREVEQLSHPPHRRLAAAIRRRLSRRQRGK